MAGSPRKRERREVAAAAGGVAEAAVLEGAGMKRRRARPVDVARRRAVVERAGEIGDARAALEANVAVSTVRSWRKRLADGAVDGEVVAGEVVPSEVPGGVNVEQLLRTAHAARKVVELAIGRLEVAIETARNPRDLSIAVGVLIDKSRELDETVLALQEREARMSEARAQQIASLIRFVFEQAGLPVPGPMLRYLLELGPGVELHLPDGMAEAFRAEVVAGLAGELGRERAPGVALERVEAGELVDGEAVTDAEVVEDEPASVEDVPVPAEGESECEREPECERESEPVSEPRPRRAVSWR